LKPLLPKQPAQSGKRQPHLTLFASGLPYKSPAVGIDPTQQSPEQLVKVWHLEITGG